MREIIVSNKELENQTKLQYLEKKYNSEVRKTPIASKYEVKDEGSFIVVSEREDELRRYASHLFYKNHPFKALTKWHKGIIWGVEKKFNTIKDDDREIVLHLNEDEKQIIEDSLWRKCRRDGIDW